ncbi:hypothetical protein FQA39_LY14941 [Lamprigera yunnana]|nr:hypothetical protein FQA39_LY14941 [Lamprigera yunnana]
MKFVSGVCVLSAFLAISLAAPTPIDETNLVPVHSQVIDNVIQNVTSQVFRVVGGALLRSGGLGGGSGGGGGGRVNVVLPTFPPDEDEDDDNEDEDLNIRNIINSTTVAGVQANPLRILPELNEVDANSNLINNENTLTTELDTPIATTAVNVETMLITPSSIKKRSARKIRETNDQETSVSGGNGPNPADDLSDVEADESDRNKRYLPFGGDGQGSAGGSGNFLFDLIRLVAGSGTTEETDEKTVGAGGVAEIDVSAKGNGEGIPGPITRLLVVANRGIANLIQELILRLAQTSERIVNFKARLVTALI